MGNLRPVLAVVLLLVGCAETNAGQACADDSACDPGDSCVASACAADLTSSVFSITPAAATVSTSVGHAPAPVAFSLADSAKAGHPFSVSCGGGATASPASGTVKSAKAVSISVQAPAPTAAGSAAITCQVTSSKSTTAKATFTLTVKAGAAADFSVAATPAALSIAQGASGTASIQITGSGGFAAAVALSISGVPAGASAAISPTSILPGASATLTVQAGTALAGAHPLAISATSGAISRSVSVPLTISAAGGVDYSISLNPKSITVKQGASAAVAVQVVGTNGFAGQVALSAAGLPSGVAATFSPASIAPGATSTLTLAASSAAAVLDSSVSIAGASGSLQRTAALALGVQAGTASTPIGPAGGAVDLLHFVLTGDTRPSACDLNTGYPAAQHAQILRSMGALSPQFGLDLGDHMYVCSQSLANAQNQMNQYVAGLQGFPAYFAMTMGNHECGGSTDCSNSPNDANYSTYLAALKQVSKQTNPNYALQIQTRLGRATVVVVADNSFSATDRAWLEATLSDADQGSKYTIIAKHHPVTGSRTGPAASWNVIQSHKYSLLLMAHNHDYEHSGSNVTADGRGVICGLGGADTSHTGFCRVQQAADGALHFTQYDASGNPGDTWSAAPQ